MKLSIGIDVSKEKLDVSFYDGEDFRMDVYQNSNSGILRMHKDIQKRSFEETIITMEATGTYHLKAAKKFFKLNYVVSVVNPLIIKRFSEMKMKRVKTDSADAKIIAEYGFHQEPKIYKPKSMEMELVLQLSKSIEALNTMKNENKNRIEALKQNPDFSGEVLKIYSSLNNTFNRKIKIIENRINELVKDNETCKRFKSVPGIGNRIAPVMTSIFGKFENFENFKQVSSFIGVNPSPFQSGSSVKGRGSISKKGNSYLRKLLYMATLSAIQSNKSCAELYERLVLKGKNKRLALIAVANKLVRQMFAIVKYNRMYNENFQNI